MKRLAQAAPGRWPLLDSVILLGCLAASLLPADARVLQDKTLQRLLDPVVIEGKHLKNLLGASVSKLALLAERDGRLVPIPFQVDKRRGDDYLLPAGPEGLPEKDEIEPQDELVFLARDTGGQVTEVLLPPGVKDHVEIEIRDPLKISRGWVYLVLFEGEPAAAVSDYVRYDPQTETIEAEKYRLQFASYAPMVFDYLTARLPDGSYGRNFLDRLKIRFRAKPAFLPTVIDKSEEEFKTRLLAYKDGPVRLIRKTESRLTFFQIFESPKAISYQEFYGHLFSVPLVVDLPFNVGDIFSWAKITLTTEMRSGGRGIYYNEHNLAGVEIDGLPSEAEKSLDPSPFRWAVMKSLMPESPGAMFNINVLPDYFPDRPLLYYVDDLHLPDPPENEPGQWGNVGYTIQKFHWLKEGSHKLSSILYVLDDFAAGDEKEVLDVYDAPVQFWVGKAASSR